MKLRPRKSKVYHEEQEEPEALVCTKKQPKRVPKRKITEATETDEPLTIKTKTKRRPNKIYTFLEMQRIYKVFFEFYTMEKKMPSTERAEILELIGASGEKDIRRKLSFRLQNHKVRNANEAKAYKRLFEEGRIHNYESYLTYIFNNHVPELDNTTTGAGGPSVQDAEQQQHNDASEVREPTRGDGSPVQE